MAIRLVTSLLSCPRCGAPLFRDLEQDYGICLVHGTVFLGIIPYLRQPILPKRRVRSRKVLVLDKP